MNVKIAKTCLRAIIAIIAGKRLIRTGLRLRNFWENFFMDLFMYIEGFYLL
jgi:hypothetical protein